MDAKTLFVKKFQRLMGQGVHLAASLVDQDGELQATEIYGADLIKGDELKLNLYASKLVVPEFYEAASIKNTIAVNLCSPMSFETYQIKGLICTREELNDSHMAWHRFWFENYAHTLSSIGILDETLKNLNYQPDFLVSMRVDQIYLQTPAQGTGNLL